MMKRHFVAAMTANKEGEMIASEVWSLNQGIH
jgi:hypothetical protein